VEPPADLIDAIFAAAPKLHTELTETRS